MGCHIMAAFLFFVMKKVTKNENINLESVEFEYKWCYNFCYQNGNKNGRRGIIKFGNANTV